MRRASYRGGEHALLGGCLFHHSDYCGGFRLYRHSRNRGGRRQDTFLHISYNLYRYAGLALVAAGSGSPGLRVIRNSKECRTSEVPLRRPISLLYSSF